MVTLLLLQSTPPLKHIEETNQHKRAVRMVRDMDPYKDLLNLEKSNFESRDKGVKKMSRIMRCIHKDLRFINTFTTMTDGTRINLSAKQPVADASSHSV